MDKEKVVIELKNGQMAVLTLQAFDTEVDIDSILKIDYGNVMGEILTFPLIFNRIANLKAEMENLVAEEKLDCDIFEAQLTEEKRKNLLAQQDKATESAVASAVKMDSRYALKRKNLFKLQKNLAYLDSLYWSAKSKDGKLDRLSEKLRPDEFGKELIEDTINGVMIKFTKKAIQ